MISICLLVNNWGNDSMMSQFCMKLDGECSYSLTAGSEAALHDGEKNNRGSHIFSKLSTEEKLHPLSKSHLLIAFCYLCPIPISSFTAIFSFY